MFWKRQFQHIWEVEKQLLWWKCDSKMYLNHSSACVWVCVYDECVHCVVPTLRAVQLLCKPNYFQHLEMTRANRRVCWMSLRVVKWVSAPLFSLYSFVTRAVTASREFDWWVTTRLLMCVCVYHTKYYATFVAALCTEMQGTSQVSSGSRAGCELARACTLRQRHRTTTARRLRLVLQNRGR
jgi:hypothetical protein